MFNKYIYIYYQILISPVPESAHFWVPRTSIPKKEDLGDGPPRKVRQWGTPIKPMDDSHVPTETTIYNHIQPYTTLLYNWWYINIDDQLCGYKRYTPKVPAISVSTGCPNRVATRIGSFLEHRIHTLHPPQLSFLGYAVVAWRGVNLTRLVPFGTTLTGWDFVKGVKRMPGWHLGALPAFFSTLKQKRNFWNLELDQPNFIYIIYIIRLLDDDYYQYYYHYPLVN